MLSYYEPSSYEPKERKAEFRSISGLPVKRLYTAQDAEIDYDRDLGEPGQFPFTRGVQPTMYRGRLWTMRQYAGFGTAEESNKRYKYLLGAGQTGLSVAFDLPTQMGFDSDDAMACGEVGRVGVAIDSLEDMEILLDGIPLDKVSTSMTINSTASILLALYLCVADKQGVSWDKLRGTVQNDILKEYIARGTYIYPVKPSMRIITDLFQFCKNQVPNWNAISVSGYHMREAGCTAVQEVAFTLMDGVAYLEAAIKAGLDVDDIAPQISFFFGVHNDFLEEISKFRAARRMWARIVRERFKAKKDDSCKLRFHSQTAGCSLTAQQPHNNIVRVTMQALSSVLGGTQSLHTNSFDEALALPTEESARIALRTQQIIGYESGVANTVDPCAGSYVIESFTNRIEKEALALMKKVEDLGGMLAAIDKGFVQKEIQNSAFQYQRDIEEKNEIIVGVNEFQMQGEKAPPIQRIDPQLEIKKKEQLKKFRSSRDQSKTDQTMKHLEEAAKGTQNLIPFIYEAVKNKATLGEISHALRRVFGLYKENVVL
ncbi:MAG: methylmalonyl-CoA mutase family protein [Deltaproteobacteria bacterium]|nr:MAG: methylmalonyl-CoA mutase family protein [Deltaproteobacteria bacterium]